MSWIFPERSNQPERIDLEALDSMTAGRLMKALERTNAWLGGVHATLASLKRFAKTWAPGERIHMIDWGTGGADIPRAIVRWCRRHGFRADIVAVDNNPTIAEYAQEACSDYPEISVHVANLENLALEPGSFDYAISSLTLHHLSNTQVVDLLKQSDRVTRRGIIMNDLKRSARAWAWIWGLGQLLRAPEMFRHDAPLSVRRAFTKPELETLARNAGLPYLGVSTHFGYRYVLSGEKPR